MNFVVYENNEKKFMEYKNIIFKLMSGFKICYKTILVRPDEELDLLTLNGAKIFIVDEIDIVRKIRESGDYNSQIIFMIDEIKSNIIPNVSNLLILDFISKTNYVFDNLYNALKVAMDISGMNSMKMCFSYENEYYQIPYKDILYIEKILNDNTSLIVTKNNKYVVRKSIVKLEKELCNKDMFFKTHRSCIVNMDNIIHVDFNEGIINFLENEIKLLSRSKKKELKCKLLSFVV